MEVPEWLGSNAWSASEDTTILYSVAIIHFSMHGQYPHVVSGRLFSFAIIIFLFNAWSVPQCLGYNYFVSVVIIYCSFIAHLLLILV